MAIQRQSMSHTVTSLALSSPSIFSAPLGLSGLQNPYLIFCYVLSRSWSFKLAFWFPLESRIILKSWSIECHRQFQSLGCYSSHQCHLQCHLKSVFKFPSRYIGSSCPQLLFFPLHRRSVLCCQVLHQVLLFKDLKLSPQSLLNSVSISCVS
jgi:hypothetical protein